MPQYKKEKNDAHEFFQGRCDTILKTYYEKSANSIASVKDFLFQLYFELFQCTPHIIELDFDGVYLNKEYEDEISKKNMFDCTKDSDSVGIYLHTDDGDTITIEDEEDWPRGVIKDSHAEHFTFKNKDILETASEINLIENYNGDELAVYRVEEHPVIIMGDGIKTIFYKKDNYLRILTATDTIPDYITNNIVLAEEDEEQPYFDYVVYDNHGFNTTELPVKSQTVDLSLNYNDDLPHEHIKNFINNAESGLCILHGVPGSGKTTYIRHLMKECKDANFMILNTSCFDAINDTSFVNLIVRNQGSTIILEDCEDMLSERLNGNSRIATLLNLSDGILGDALRLKFICTFNAKIGKIDPAILRKGRTHVMYEFKELSKEKAEKLAETLGVSLPEKKGKSSYSLAEIYNIDNNQVDAKISNKVGFKR